MPIGAEPDDAAVLGVADVLTVSTPGPVNLMSCGLALTGVTDRNCPAPAGLGAIGPAPETAALVAAAQTGWLGERCIDKLACVSLVPGIDCRLG